MGNNIGTQENIAPISIVGVVIIIGIIISITGSIYNLKPNKKNKRSWKNESKNITIYKTEKLQNQQYQQLPYYLMESVLTNYEKKLYSILAPFCFKYNFILLSKVRIADFVQPLKQYNKGDFYHWFNKIALKHVDFLICQPETFKPLVAIELDDYTHKYKDRQERDVFIDNVYASIKLPILHVIHLQEDNIIKILSQILNINLSIDNAPIQ